MVVGNNDVLSPVPACVPGEFERQSALLIDVNELLALHPHVLTGLVSALIDRLPLIAVISGEEQRRDLLTNLCDWGLPAHRVRAVRSAAAGQWLRDYGPQFVRRDGRLNVVDADWGPDDRLPEEGSFPTDLARLLDLEIDDVRLRIDGGNILSNGHGLLLTTSGVVARNTGRQTASAVLSHLSRHYGFRQIACLPPLESAPAARVDGFATFTSPDTLLLGRCDAEENPANAAMLDRVAEYVRGMHSGAGPLKVERIPMPPTADGVWRTYTNAVYANGAVVVPVYAGVDPRIEREVLDVYRLLLPGREVIPVEATSLAKAGGALRSVTLNVPNLGHPMPLEDAGLPTHVPAPAQPLRPSRLDAFVAGGGGWYGPRRSVLQMDA